MGDDGDGIVGEAAYRFTEAEFIAAFRARRIAINKRYDSWWARALLVVEGLLLFPLGAFFLYLWIEYGASWLMALNAVFWPALGAWIVDEWLYGYRRRFRALYRAHPLADRDVALTFTADRFFFHASNLDESAAWSADARVTEFRDGFLLLGGAWVPKDAPLPPFDAAALAGFLRSKAKKYRTIDRRARIRERGRPDGRP